MALALLIDGETIPPFVVEEMLLEIDAYGEVAVKRLYANWTPKAVHVWNHTINMYGFDPIQQYPCVYPRTSGDGMMIIDAMDLLHRGSLSGFCIASNSDAFARLATRLRESGVVVHGFGDDTVRESFVRSCNSFVKLEVLGLPNPLRPQVFHRGSGASESD